MRVVSTNALEVGDMVRFTKNSKNSGKTAKVTDINDDHISVYNPHGLICTDGSINSEVTVGINSPLIEKI